MMHFTRMLSSDISITYSLAKCGSLFVNRGKVKSTSGISLPKAQINDIDKKYKYLGIM